MLEAIGIAAMFGSLGIVLSGVAYFLFDLVEVRIDFTEEIKKGNIAASVVIAAFVLGVCFIVGRAVGS